MTTTRPPARAAAANRRTRPPEPEPQAPRAAVVAVRRLFAAEAPEFFLLLGTTIFLVVFGLVMVLSSSSIESYVDSKDFFTTATRQGLYALIGVPVMLIAARAPISFWKRWARAAVFLGIGAAASRGLHPARVGQRVQPELAPHRLVHRAAVRADQAGLRRLAGLDAHDAAQLLDDWKRILFAIGPVVGLSIGLVLFGADLGTAVIMISIALGALFFAGVKLRWIAAALAVISVIALIFVQLSGSRSGRVAAWLGGCTNPDLARTSAIRSRTAGSRWRTAASSGSGSATPPASGRGFPKPTTTSSSRSSAKSSACSARSSCSGCSSCWRSASYASSGCRATPSPSSPPPRPWSGSSARPS